MAEDHAQRMQEGQRLFVSTVRRLLEKHCLDCHGGRQTKADFSLADRDLLLESGMVEERADTSRLVQLIRHEEEPYMPHKAPRLKDDEIESIARWIDLGAPYDRPLAGEQSAGQGNPPGPSDFWSFQPLAPAALPELAHSEWAASPMDAFVLAELKAAGLHGNPAADRRTLIRRAYFDLLGLPPAPETIQQFVDDGHPLAYQRLIDRLLGSPHFGERWARHWMDVVRFAESHGYEQDYDRPHAYPYRDFLIQAINSDLPYDQFVAWQLAGDELAPESPLAAAATGFLAAGAFPTQLTEAEFESARYDELDDMTSTTGLAFLGLSVGCARCHDHKYDPVPSADYYGLAATFGRTIRSEIEMVLEPAREPVKVQVAGEGLPPMKHHADERGFPHFYPDTYLLTRGDVNQKQGIAEPGYLSALMHHGRGMEYWKRPQPPGWTRSGFHRASLAAWITDTRDGAGGLASRVIVNRLWQHHFGQGLVATPNDFGMQGAVPSHPRLLEWLANDLVEHQWHLKRLHRLMMTSSVYMQSTAHDALRGEKDRENRLLWRRSPWRLESEPIRDAMLAVSGRLDTRIYGPGTLDEAMQRRSVYFFIKRSQLVPTMMLFDWPEHLVSIGTRGSTTIAPQALLLINNPQVRLCAEQLAVTLTRCPDGERLDEGYELALGRRPTGEELRIGRAFLESQTTAHRSAGHDAPAALALADFCQALFAMNEFVYVD